MNIQQQSDIPTDIKSTQLLNPAAKPIQGFCVCACDVMGMARASKGCAMAHHQVGIHHPSEEESKENK